MAPLPAGTARWLPTALTAAIGLLFAADTLAWTDGSAPWLHTDGVIHLERMRLYAAGLSGEVPAEELRSITGYGPIVYLVTGAVMALEGAQTWMVGVHAQLLFALTGFAGVGLMAARLGGPWAAPVAAALLAGLPVWRTHTVDLMVDQPGASLAALALGLLVWTEGLKRPRWILGAAVASGLALGARWPTAFLLAPAWGLAVLGAGLDARARAPRLLGGALLVAAVTGGLLLAPLALKTGLGTLLRTVLTVGVATLGAHLVTRPPKTERWLWRCLGGGLVLGAVLLPITLWAPAGLASAIGAQVDMEAGLDAAGVQRPGVAAGLAHALSVLVTWQTGPVVGILGGLAVVQGLRLRRREAVLMVAGFGVNLAVILTLLAQPDERHVLAGLPVLVALAASLPGLLADRHPTLGRPAVGAGIILGIIGLTGLVAWRAPSVPGVVAADLWHRDINLVREPRAGLGWPAGGAPWVSLRPFTGGPQQRLADAVADALDGSAACLAWVFADDIRGDIHVPQTVQGLLAPLTDRNPLVRGEDPYDRQGSDLRQYDGAVVFAPPGSALASRVRRALPEAQELVEVRVDSWTATALLNPGGWSDAGCDGRYPGRTLWPLGTGFDRREGPMVGLPPGPE